MVGVGGQGRAGQGWGEGSFGGGGVIEGVCARALASLQPRALG